MATDRQNQFLPSTKEFINLISQTTPESLVQRERLGSELCFEAVVPIAEKIIEITKELQRLNLEEVPYTTLSAITSWLEQINSIFTTIKAIAPADIPRQKDSFLNQLEDYWANLYPQVYSIVAAQQSKISQNEMEALYSQVTSSAQLASEATENLRSKQAEISTELEKFLEKKSLEFQIEGNTKLSKVDAALESIRAAAAEAGVSQNSVHFRTEADDHLTSSQRWLKAIIILSILLVCFSLWGTKLFDFVGLQDPGSNSDLILQIRFYLQKTVILFVLIFALILATKNYNSARHNYVVNKHRSNSLSSFQAFVASASDEQTKNAVLLQATQSIFSHQPSGYIKTDGENSSQGTVIEVMRSIGTVNKDKAS